jgi:hypothetical protein
MPMQWILKRFATTNSAKILALLVVLMNDVKHQVSGT